MAITVAELIGLPELQLTLIAGAPGIDRTIEWAHTCDLPDPWRWVGTNQALLTNGSTIPISANDQVSWVKALVEHRIAAIGIGVEMGGASLTTQLIRACDELGLPMFTIPYPLPFVAVAQAVAESASLAQTVRLRILSRLYDFSGRDLADDVDSSDVIESIGQIIGQDIVVVDEHCWGPWRSDVDLPKWVLKLAEFRAHDERIKVPTLWESASSEVAHVIPLGALQGALAIFRPNGSTLSDQSTLLHAASVLGIALSRREFVSIQNNRIGSEFLSRILIDQNRFGFESAGWMHQLGYVGRVRGICLVGPAPRREATVARLQRHGVRLSVTMQNDRHLLVAQSSELRSLLDHCIDRDARAGIGLEVEVGSVHESLKQSLWALQSGTGRKREQIVEFDPGQSWMGFHDPQSGEEFASRVLGPLLDESPTHSVLLKTLEAYFEVNRSPQRAANILVVHRQTVIQRLKKIEAELSVSLADTSAIARLWVAVTIHQMMRGAKPTAPGSL